MAYFFQIIKISRLFFGLTLAYVGLLYSIPTQGAINENCTHQYEPIDLPFFYGSIFKSFNGSADPENRALQDEVQKLFLAEREKENPAWAAPSFVDLGKRLQSALLKNHGRKDEDVLRSYWHLMLIAQKQWDILGGSVRKSQGFTRQWQSAEYALASHDYGQALIGFKKSAAMQRATWLDFRMMETSFLRGYMASSGKILKTMLEQELLKEPHVRDHFHLFLLAYARKTDNLPHLFQLLDEKKASAATQQLAYCVLQDPHLTVFHAVSLEALLKAKGSDSLVLGAVLRAMDKVYGTSRSTKDMLRWLPLVAGYSVSHFSTPSDHHGDDAYRLSQSLRVFSEKILTLVEPAKSVPSLNILDDMLQRVIPVIEKYSDTRELVVLRARLQERVGRYGDATYTYKKLAFMAREEGARRKFADLMFKNLMLALPELKKKKSLEDICQSYQKLNVGQGPALRQCDMWQAEAALQRRDVLTGKKIFWHLIHDDPQSAEASLAARSLLKLARPQANELLATSEELLNIPFFQQDPWGSELHNIRRKSSFERIASLSSREDQIEAYVTFSQREKGSPLARESLLRAVRMDQTIGRSDRAMDRLAQYIKDYPSELDTPAHFIELLDMAEKAMQIQRIKEYLRLVPALSLAAVQTAYIAPKACMFEMFDQPLQAVTICQSIKSQQISPSFSTVTLARSLAQAQEGDALYDYTKKNILPDSSLTLDGKVTVLYELFGLTNLAPWKREEVKTILYNLYLEHEPDLGPESRTMLAGLAYEEAHKALPHYLSQPIYGARSDELVGSIQAKKQSYDDLDALYTKVLKTKDPRWGSSALCDMGLAAENLADAMEHIPEVEGVDRKELITKIAGEISNQRAKAKNYVFEASRTVEKFEVFHEDNKRVLKEADRLRQNPIQYDDWLLEPSAFVLEGRTSGTDMSWDHVEREMLQSSTVLRNKGEPAADVLLKAFHIALEKGDFLRAEWVIDRLKRRPVPSTQALGFLSEARLRGRLKQWLAMESALKRTLSLKPDFKDAALMLGHLYAYFGFFEKAYPYVRDFEDDPQALQDLLVIERHIDLKEKADQHCAGLFRHDQVSPTVLYNCGLLELQNHGNPRRARELMTQVIASDSKDTALKRAAEGELAAMGAAKPPRVENSL